jgi:hypothetical protein
MLDKKIKSVTALVVTTVLMSCSLTLLAAYQPFPGKHKVRIIRIDSAKSISVNFETWPGYARTVNVVLPNVSIPGESVEPSNCELKLEAEALAFTTQFVSAKNSVYITELELETSADNNGAASVYSSKGSLAIALEEKGLARSNSIDSETPWCQ